MGGERSGIGGPILPGVIEGYRDISDGIAPFYIPTYISDGKGSVEKDYGWRPII